MVGMRERDERGREGSGEKMEKEAEEEEEKLVGAAGIRSKRRRFGQPKRRRFV